MKRPPRPPRTTPAVKASKTVAICCALSILAACGQRGPLYLPDDGEESSGPASGSPVEKEVEESDEETP